MDKLELLKKVKALAERGERDESPRRAIEEYKEEVSA